MNIQNFLLTESKKPNFKVGSFQIVSQMPSVITSGDRIKSTMDYLPQFLLFWHDLETATGYRWKNTSYIRDSPSHRMGQAFDLAPDFTAEAAATYAVGRNSDPVLYKRIALWEILKTLRSNDYSGDASTKLGVFIEPDHLHLQVLSHAGGGEFPTNIIKWRIAKPIYPDTYERMKLAAF